jgi:PKD repeat protein
VWTTADAGTTWSPRSDQAASLAVGAVAADPSNPEHLIAGTGEANQCGDCAAGRGLLASTDGGQTWSLEDPGGVFDVLHIAAVAVAPRGGRMYAATDGGLYVSGDGGLTWAKPTGAGYAAVDGRITAVVLDPSTPATVYIGGGPAVVAKSTDGGTTWAPAAAGIAPPAAGTRPLVALGLAPSSPSTLYTSVGTTGPLRVYKTTDGGGSWSRLAGAPDYTSQDYAYGGTGGSSQGWYDNVLAVDPTDANHVMAGGIALVETTDGGGSWRNVNGQNFFGPGENLLHPDFHALAFAGAGSVWVGNDGGVFVYHPATRQVENGNGNLDITQLYFGFSAVAGLILAGSQDNGSALGARSSLAWAGVFSGDGGPSAITPNRSQLQFVEADQSLYRSSDAFASDLTDITPPALGLFTPPMIVIPNTSDPSNPTVLYGGPDVYRTTDPSAVAPKWKAATALHAYVSALAASPSNPSVVYTGFTNGTVEVSTDGGATFTSLAVEPFNEHFVTGISVDPADPRRITASFSYSDTRNEGGFPHVAQYAFAAGAAAGSGTWTGITGNLPADAAVSRVVYDNGALVAATDSGAYGTSAAAGSATAWSRVGSGLPNVQVQDLDVEADGLYAVTHGRGAWRLAPGDEAPTAAYTPSTYTPPAGQAVTFRAGASDPDGTISSYVWKWGDGTPDGSGPTANHVFTAEGIHSVGLYVTDTDGGTTAVGHGITVGDELPSVAYTPSTYTPPAGQTVTFRATASDPDGTISGYLWKWGDGTADGSGATATHVFAAEGPHSVGLYATDSAGRTNAVGHGITVGDDIPSVAYVPSTYAAAIGQTVTFTGTASDPDGTVTAYRWKWGDGTPDASGPSASHAFNTAGVHSVGLYVTDSAGQTNAAGHGITVSAP